MYVLPIALLGMCLMNPPAQRGSSFDEACPPCVIETKTIAVIRGDSVGTVNRVIEDARGRWWIFSAGHLPAVFDADGEFLTVIGSRGQGPGEMFMPSSLWTVPGDTSAVLDARGQLHLFDPELEYIRSLHVDVRGIYDAIVVDWPERIVVSANINSEQSAGFPLHRFALSGSSLQLVESFGSDGVLRPELALGGTRHSLSPANGADYWAAFGTEYLVQEWRDGAVRRQIERRPSWFPRESNMSPGGPEIPPSPWLIGASEDERGLLWTYTLVPAANWQQGWAGVESLGRGELLASRVDWDALYHTIVEVVDPSTSTVLAGLELQWRIFAVFPHRRAALLRTAEDGTPLVQVISLELNER